MTTICHRDEAEKTRRRTRESVFRTDFLRESGGVGSVSPNCKLIEQDPNSTLGAHFHSVSQFQVVVAGSGFIGRHRAEPLFVQFAAPGTTYGPLQAEENGLSYLVFRDGVDGGARWMPDSRHDMARADRRRHVVSEPWPAKPLGPNGTATARPLIAAEPDGLEATTFTLPAGAAATCRARHAGGARFLVVHAGAVASGDDRLVAGSCMHLSAADDPPELRAGPDGAEVLLLQFPVPGGVADADGGRPAS